MSCSIWVEQLRRLLCAQLKSSAVLFPWGIQIAYNGLTFQQADTETGGGEAKIFK